MTTMPKPPEVPGSIDFELTDFADARRNLELLPEGVAEAQRLQPGYWEHQRRPLTATDKALTGNTMEWVMRLPAPVRPLRLCERHPRVANLIADAWLDIPRRDAVFDRLLNDERGGRRGFAGDVAQELLRLSEYRTARDA
jgi:hypothetical protein